MNNRDESSEKKNQNNRIKIYVASSWRTERHDEVVKTLKNEGFDVFDYRKDTNFSWSYVDSGKIDIWSKEKHREVLLTNKHVEKAFDSDMNGLNPAQIVIAVQPFGTSVALELGYAVGQGKKTFLLLDDNEAPELMLKMVDIVAIDLQDIIYMLRMHVEHENRPFVY